MGSLVKTAGNQPEALGVVCSAETHSLEEGRKPIARGTATGDEDVFKQHPQLEVLLCTYFKAFVVGHSSEGKVFWHLPPQPARIHSFVCACSVDEVRQFGQSLSFLRTIVADRSTPWVDEVIAACLRNIAATNEDGQAFLVRAGRELATLLSADYNRLTGIIAKVRR